MRRCVLLSMVSLALAAVCFAAPADFPVPPKWSAVLTRSGAIETKHGHIQGICAAQDAVYMTLVNGLYKFDWQGRLVKRINLNPHVGDICLWKDRLYLVTCGGGKGAIEVFDCNLSHIKGAASVRPSANSCRFRFLMYSPIGRAVGALQDDHPHRHRLCDETRSNPQMVVRPL